ncbi:MAG TPA: hypothetical protein VMA73_31200 [Streptosporangiaceae bacterium]|nr:hypothetical protein [Streptosporangiaceae bacterium]
MDAGVNYPWFSYGWDFGAAPPGWRDGNDPAWLAHIGTHLEHLAAIGISVLRWFILGDGLSYGTGPTAPAPDRSATGDSTGWRFDPPALTGEFRQHFAAVLQSFAAQTAPRPVRLLPVLADYKFCEPGVWPVSSDDAALRQGGRDEGWVKGGRAEAITANRQRFIGQVLEPLLRLSRGYPDTIYAWDIFNEPEWVTNGWHPDRGTDHPVNESEMRAFLEDAASAIRDAGFSSTIGFGLIETIRQTHLYADINQFHHYTDGSRFLERNPFDPRQRAIVGEFATSTAEDTWPELRQRSQRILERLRLAESQGYDLALAWSFQAHDRHTSWTPQAENDIKCFTQERNCP